MSVQRKQVVRLNLGVHPIYKEQLAQQGDINLTILPLSIADDEAWPLFRQAHIYQVSSTKDELPKRFFVTAELLERCPNLLCVSTTGAGFDTVDVAACTAAGVLLANQSGSNANAVAEQVFGSIIGICRRLFEADRRMRTERNMIREELMGRELRSHVLGLVGIGNIGTRVAEIARVFGMKVLATDPYLSAEEIARRGAQAVSFTQLLEQADIVSLHCPRNQETLNMMDAKAYAAMKGGAYFISTARGGIHNETALLQALESGHLAGAALDVWDVEPPPLDHPLLQLDNVVASFHTAGVTPEARRAMSESAVAQIVSVSKGGRPRNLINPEVWPTYVERYARIIGGHVQPDA